MKTIDAEVKNILAEFDGQLQACFHSTPMKEARLADFIFSQLLEAANTGANTEALVNEIFVHLEKLELPQEYLKHILKSCGHAASAVCSQRTENEVLAWKHLYEAKAQAGCALALYVSNSELKHSQQLEAAKSKSALSEAGLQGAMSRNKPFAELKAWIFTNAITMRGSDMDIARKLSGRLPLHLADVTQTPERFIYDTLRSRKKAI